MKPKSFSSTCTKHYYTSTTLSAGTSAALNMGIGSERIASTLGTRKNLGVLCEAIYGTVSAEIIMEMNLKVKEAGGVLADTYAVFEKKIDLDIPYLYSENEYIANCGDPDPDRYASFWFHPDHLGSSNYITDMSGNISQHPCPERSRRVEYLPFGETLVEEHKNSNNSPYKFNGKELDDETGNYYYGARYYNPKWSFWLSVDPLAEKYPGWSPYNYTLNNPVNMTDPTGMAAEWIEVTQNDDGTYNVEDGVRNADKNVYVVDENGDRTGEILGEMLTEYSFFDNEEVVKGAKIDMKSTSGQDFLNQLKEDNPSLLGYMWNARNGEKYDFKDIDIKNRGGVTMEQYRYRGSVNTNGNIGSARDYGNMGAGMVAARKGLSWETATFGFDLYQGFSSNGLTPIPTIGGLKGSGGIPAFTILPEREPSVTRKAEKIGYEMGKRLF